MVCLKILYDMFEMMEHSIILLDWSNKMYFNCIEGVDMGKQRVQSKRRLDFRNFHGDVNLS